MSANNLPDQSEHTHDAHSPSARQVFEILFLDHADMLEAYLRTLLGSSPDLDDIFQETMLVAYRRLNDYERDRPFGAWLRGIARVLVLESARKGRARPRASDPLLLQAIDKRFHEIEQREGDTFSDRTRQLLDCVEKLPDKLRNCIELIYMRGLSIAQASVSLATGQEAMKKRVQRGRALLADCLGINRSND